MVRPKPVQKRVLRRLTEVHEASFVAVSTTPVFADPRYSALGDNEEPRTSERSMDLVCAQCCAGIKANIFY